MFWLKLVTALTLVSSTLAFPSVQRRGIDDGINALNSLSHSHLHRRAAGSASYTVVSGDTGNAIAAVYSITFNTLSNANPNVNWNSLQVGQTLVMPSARTPIVYTVSSGDTQSSIANKYDVYSADLGTANPNANFNSLPAGSTLRVPGYGSWTTYTVASGDTGNGIATAEGISFSTLQSANPNVNWNNLQVGQVLTVPAGTSPSTGTIPSPAPSPTSTVSSTTLSTTTSTITPTVTSSSTTRTSISISQTNTVSAPNAVTTINNSDPAIARRGDTYTFYKGDGSATASWPAMSQWVSFNTMWNRVAPYIGQSCTNSWGVANNSPAETQDLYNAIQDVAAKSYVDHRFILATIIQESSGCVRVPTTVSPGGVTNPGLMQDHSGSGNCNYPNGTILNPCPTQNIYQMVEDGTFGTSSGGARRTPLAYGLVSDLNGNSAYTGSQAFYRAARIYNAGSIPDSQDLGAPGATRCYCSDIANRLMGWVTATKTCNLDS